MVISDTMSINTRHTGRRKPEPSDKILIVIPYWEGDRVAAISLSHLLADLQPSHSEEFDIVFVGRWDTKPIKPTTIAYVSRKFNVFQHESKRRETGWPMGCNGLFFGSLEFCYHMMDAGKIPHYKAIFICAGDSVPVSRGCFDYLHRQWDKLSAEKSLSVAGALIPGEHEHINGDCCLLSGDLGFLKWLVKDVGGIKVRAGWDWVLAPDFEQRGWADLPGVVSLWQTPTMSEETAAGWVKRGIVWIHGVKDDSLIKFARKTNL